MARDSGSSRNRTVNFRHCRGRTMMGLMEARRETRDPAEMVENSDWLGFRRRKERLSWKNNDGLDRSMAGDS